MVSLMVVGRKGEKRLKYELGYWVAHPYVENRVDGPHRIRPRHGDGIFNISLLNYRRTLILSKEQYCKSPQSQPCPQDEDVGQWRR